MPETEINSEVKIDTKVYPHDCPVCGMSTNYTYGIDDGKDKSAWYRCNCGVIFQKDLPVHGCYDEEYVKGYADFKDVDLVQTHAARAYASLIEELTYGRRMLDVGFNLPQNMNYFKDRGWITQGIDINPTFKDSKNIFVGDFAKYEKLHPEYSLIWMSHVLEHFENPIGVLQKAKDLLVEDGVLYISTPDIEFMNKTGVSGWPHWNKREHYVMWSLDALVRELERLGFKIIMKRRNFSSRFVAWFDLQILCQRNYF
jgi:SAM-dependent methyltransferase